MDCETWGKSVVWVLFLFACFVLFICFTFLGDSCIPEREKHNHLILQTFQTWHKYLKVLQEEVYCKVSLLDAYHN